MTRSPSRDRGSVLPMVLVVVIVLGAVVAAIASYASATLRYGQVAETRTDRFAAADGALRAAIEQLRIIDGNSPCLDTTVTAETFTSPVQVNGADSSYTCRQAAAGFGTISRWALILTGIGVPSGEVQLSSQQGNGVNKKIGGPVFMASPASNNLQGTVELQNGDVYYPLAGCSVDGDPRTQAEAGLPASRFLFTPTGRGPICVDPATAGSSPRSEFTVPDLSDLAPNPPPDDVTFPGCRVFSQGRYTNDAALELATGSGNYFRSGRYVFENAVLSISGQGQNRTAVLIGAPDSAAGIAPKLLPLTDGCNNAMVADLAELAATGTQPGATVYMAGSSRIELGNRGTLEMLPRRVSGFDWVSLHALSSSTLNASGSHLIDVTTQGNAKELRVNGWIWAPRASVYFANVTGDDMLMELSGGSVLAQIHLGANATASEFQIAVPSTPARTTYVIRGVAEKDGTAEVEAVVEYIPPNRVAVRSWRVLN